MKEQERLELELRRAKPAQLPEDFAARLLAAKPQREVVSGASVFSVPEILRLTQRWLNLLIPSAAVALVVLLAWPESQTPVRRPVSALPLSLKANDVKIDQRLISSFDAVARLPDGVPVRVRCENWMDQIVLHDASQGLVVKDSQPRVRIVPVGFDTY